MKKITLILIAIMMFMTIGCSKKDTSKYNYTYKGENELWKAEFKVNGIREFTKKNGSLHYEGSDTKILTVTYKKELSKLSSVKRLGISYKSVAGGEESNLYFNEKPIDKKTFSIKSNNTSEESAMEIKDQVVKVTITVDGKTDTIELKNTH